MKNVIASILSESTALRQERLSLGNLKVTMCLYPLKLAENEKCVLSIDDDGKLEITTSDKSVFDRFSVDGRYRIDIVEILEDEHNE